MLRASPSLIPTKLSPRAFILSMWNDMWPEILHYINTCYEIAHCVSPASNMYYEGSSRFINDIENWSYTNSDTPVNLYAF
ncbi:hypothetical protein BDR07DRAFT_210142 [Suillus spraguei]|nr:hypothetical protein BDR07DRAFT_210142 [Suillus spraguei]